MSGMSIEDVTPELRLYVFVDSWKDRQRVRQWMPTRCPHCQATSVLEPRPPHCSHDWHTWTAA